MNQRPRVVVDASLAAKWLLPEPQSEAAIALLRDLVVRQFRICAPPLIDAELANVLQRQVSTRGLLPEEAEAAWRAWQGLRIEYSAPPELVPHAITLALRLGRPTIYDPMYVALADLLDCDYWTANRRFFIASQVRLPNLRWLGDYSLLRDPPRASPSPPPPSY